MVFCIIGTVQVVAIVKPMEKQQQRKWLLF